MLTDTCKDCVYCVWMVGIGQGVRCRHEGNQKYDNTYLTVISQVPEECEFYEKRGKND